MGQFSITNQPPHYHFILKNKSGETILKSFAYLSYDSCLASIAEARNLAGNDANYERHREGDKFCFFLKNKKDQRIASSPLYDSPKECEYGIASVTVYAYVAVIEQEPI